MSGLGTACFVVAGIVGTVAAEKAWLDYSVNPLITGFLLGAGVASVAWATWTMVVSADGSVSWRIGADAENWTAKELHRLGAAWHIEHDVPFAENGYIHDVDHVAIGPHGVLAVETKWTSASVDLGAKRLPKEVQDAARQAENNAGRLRGLLSRVSEIDVIPLVVFWGRDVTPPTETVRRQGSVRIVAGKQAELWRSRLNGQNLEAEMVERLSARVHGWLVEQEKNSFGADVRRRLGAAQRLSLASVAALSVIIALFPVTRAWAGLDRFLGAAFSWGGGVVGVVVLLLPLVLALAVLGCVYLARRADPTISLTRWTAPLVIWCLAFGFLLLLTP